MHAHSAWHWLLLLPISAHALGMGAAQAQSAWLYTGWACDPRAPGYQAEVHARRDDGKFLGRMLADQPLLPGVPAVCASPHGNHGFKLYINRKPQWVDGKRHSVTLYIVDHQRVAAPFAHFSLRFNEPP